MELSGKAVLITGGSRGLGRALGQRLTERGARVVLLARGREELGSAVEAIRAAGGDAHGIVDDVADKAAVYRIAGAAAELVGPIDVLIQNASTLGRLPMPLLLDTDCEDLAAVLEANLVGPFRLGKAIVGSMAARGRGVVVHVSSDAAVNGYPRWGAYGVSKAALDHLARVWAAEVEGFGVRFLSVDPGEMDTRMHADAMPDADRSVLADPGAVASRIVTMIERAESLESGGRFEAATFGPALAGVAS